MPCEEWSRLLERYCVAVNTYNQAAKALDDQPGTAFNELWQCAERPAPSARVAVRTYCTMNTFTNVWSLTAANNNPNRTRRPWLP